MKTITQEMERLFAVVLFSELETEKAVLRVYGERSRETVDAYEQSVKKLKDLYEQLNEIEFFGEYAMWFSAIEKIYRGNE